MDANRNQVVRPLGHTSRTTSALEDVFTARRDRRWPGPCFFQRSESVPVTVESVIVGLILWYMVVIRVGAHPPHGRGGRSSLGHRRAGELTALRRHSSTTRRSPRSVRNVGTGSASSARSSGTGCRTPRRLACECVPEPDSQSESSIVRHHELTALCQSPHTLLTQRDGLSISALELTALFESRHSENHIVLSSQKWV